MSPRLPPDPSCIPALLPSLRDARGSARVSNQPLASHGLERGAAGVAGAILPLGNMPSELPEIRLREAFIDESQGTMPSGRRFFVHATVIPRKHDEALQRISLVRSEHRLGDDVEVKWRLEAPHLGRDATNEVRLRAFSAATHDATCLITITSAETKNPTEKDGAFLNVLSHLHAWGKEERLTHLAVHYDRDSFSKGSSVRVLDHVRGWRDPRCSGLARHESEFSTGIQFADMVAGFWSYTMRERLSPGGRVVPEQTVNLGRGDWDVVPLSGLVSILLRWSVPGNVPNATEQNLGKNPIPIETFDKYALGQGVMLYGIFSAEERRALEGMATFWIGCMS